MKQKTYLEAMDKVDRLWAQTSWLVSGVPLTQGQRPVPYTPDELGINSMHTRLWLVTDNKRIPETFLRMFQKASKKEGLKMRDRADFLSLLRKDLFGDDLPGRLCKGCGLYILAPTSTNSPSIVAEEDASTAPF